MMVKVLARIIVHYFLVIFTLIGIILLWFTLIKNPLRFYGINMLVKLASLTVDEVFKKLFNSQEGRSAVMGAIGLTGLETVHKLKEDEHALENSEIH
jgi:spore maturation protein SpmA